MKFRAGGALALAWVLVTAADPVRAAGPALPPCAGFDTQGDLVDPRLDPARRRATLAGWEAMGREATAFQKFQLGAIYRLGPTHPAGLVDRDIDKARSLLADAAVGGELLAMASSAELELEHGNPLVGMVWAQLYAHYMQREDPSKYRTYQADLIRRGFDKLPAGDETDRAIEAYVVRFLDLYGAQIDQALARSGRDDSGSPPTCRPFDEVYPARLDPGHKAVPLAGGAGMQSRHRMRGGGLALFRLHIAPSGEVARALVVESLPRHEMSKGLKQSVMRLRFNAVAEDAPMRVVMLPMTFGDGSVKIRD